MPGLPTSLTFRVDSPLRLIELTDAVTARLLGFRQSNGGDLEAGGVLIGARRGPHVEVVDATVPQTGDARTRISFVRSAVPHRSLARAIWRKSGKVHGYLGEWHTHPEHVPSPSFTDKAGWRALAEETTAPLVHIIVGTATLSVWYCDQEGRSHKARRC